MVKETAPENWASENGMAVASPATTATLLPHKRELRDFASLESISIAVIWCVAKRNRSVVRPGPGPSSRTFSPRSALARTHGTRCSIVLRHRAERHSQLCWRFKHPLNFKLKQLQSKGWLGARTSDIMTMNVAKAASRSF